jgi:hypothetical protein
MKLYKYVSPELWDKILKAKQIRFTPPGIFNDPFEMQPFYESFAEDPEIQKNMNETEYKNVLENLFAEQYPSLPVEIQNLVPREFLAVFAEMVAPLAVNHAPELLDGFTQAMRGGFYKGFNENIGVLALTEKPDNLLMWAHYAQNHKGFVIEFDSEHEYFHQRLSPSDELRHIRKMLYSDKRPNIRISTFEDATDIFLTKSKEWEYEQEWRIMRPLQDATEIINVGGEAIHLFSFPPDCVTGIIFGCRMLPNIRKEIGGYIGSEESYSHLNKLDSVLDKREFKLNIIATEI